MEKLNNKTIQLVLALLHYSVALIYLRCVPRVKFKLWAILKRPLLSGLKWAKYYCFRQRCLNFTKLC